MLKFNEAKVKAFFVNKGWTIKEVEENILSPAGDNLNGVAFDSE